MSDQDAKGRGGRLGDVQDARRDEPPRAGDTAPVTGSPASSAPVDGSESTGKGHSKRDEDRHSGKVSYPLVFDPEGAPLPGASPHSFWFGLVVVVLSLVSGLATYLILTGLTPIAPRNEVVLIVLAVNIVLILVMFAVLVVQAIGLWRAWKRKVAGARIHVRIVGLFTVIAALPAILLAVAATITFSRSLDTWFSTRTRTIVASSLDVARAYLTEHGQVIRTDAVNMTADLDDYVRGKHITDANIKDLTTTLMAQVSLRDLSVAAIIDSKGKADIEFMADTRVAFRPPPERMLQLASEGHVPLLMPRKVYRIAAVSRLESLPGHFLYVARGVNPKVVNQVQRSQAAVTEYEHLRRARNGPKLAHAIMYFMIALTCTLAAIWVGMWFSRHLVAPIRRLISAAQHVTRGDLDVVLPLRRGEGDLRRLSRDFNNMTSELSRQRQELMSVNSQLSERRRFMEAVLSGVSAGVIGLDDEGRVSLVNPSAERMLGKTASDMIGKTFAECAPDLAAAIDGGSGAPRPRGPQDATISVDGEERRFSVRVTREDGDVAKGGVVTFDDITELVVAQRSSAWGDVARRIAHEIKNPLTPIQLSAERIRRKYGASIEKDRETFEKLTDTIVRQVGDIKTMVDEFAAFARVPKPVMGMADLRDAVQEPVILFREGHTDVEYVLDIPDSPVVSEIDSRLITQALTNLVKNATESVESAAAAKDRDAGWHPVVETRLALDDRRIVIEVIDNGLGLPKQHRARLLEPYVTTKGSKGTGLGLAIVQKIVEQHGGTLLIEDASEGPNRTVGAMVRISLPVRSERVFSHDDKKSAAQDR
ncbi:MAG: ATP-binding protein, partial [Hyphomicrobiaceae bacterium]